LLYLNNYKRKGRNQIRLTENWAEKTNVKYREGSKMDLATLSRKTGKNYLLHYYKSTKRPKGQNTCGNNKLGLLLNRQMPNALASKIWFQGILKVKM